MFRFNRTDKEKKLITDRVALESAHYFYNLAKSSLIDAASNLNEVLWQLNVIEGLDVDLSYIRDPKSEVDPEVCKYSSAKLKEADELIEKRLKEITS